MTKIAVLLAGSTVLDVSKSVQQAVDALMTLL